MIENLTKEQEGKLEYYRDKWIKIGLSTESFSSEEATEIINHFQVDILKRKKTEVVILDNPIETWYACCNGDKNIDFVYPYQDGSFYASVFSYYDFFLSEDIVKIGADLKRKFNIWKATSKLGLIYPLEDICYVCKKPTQIRKQENGLHCETGMALEYEGWGFHALNGVVVPKYLVETPSEDLDIEFFKKEQNSDVKAEFIRKYGVERMLDLGKKIDTFERYDQEDQPWWWKSEYELWDMAPIFDEITYQPFLKMLNQTTKIWHVEAVSPNCFNLVDSIKERFNGRDMKIVSIS
jgi:hypothetical protein